MSDNPDSQGEQMYLRGNRAAYLAMLQVCVKALGYDSPEASAAAWVSEREQSVAKLRSLCEDFGDNEWDESLHLADVIDKHPGEHLWATLP